MTDSAETPPAMKSSTRTIIIAVLVIVLLGGGGLVAYKLTNKQAWGPPASQVALDAEKAARAGDTAAIVKLSTATGKTQLLSLKPSDLGGWTFASCAPGFDATTKICSWSRPGGAFTMALVARDHKWLVNGVSIGAAGLPPTTTTT